MRPGLKEKINGMVLMAPLVAVHSSMVPAYPIVVALRLLSYIIPTAQIGVLSSCFVFFHLSTDRGCVAMHKILLSFAFLPVTSRTNIMC